MKKIIGIIFISLMFANIGYAEMRVIESDNIHDDNEWKLPIFEITTVCVDGFKFVVLDRYGDSEGISMVQFFEERDGKSLPAKC